MVALAPGFSSGADDEDPFDPRSIPECEVEPYVGGHNVTVAGFLSVLAILVPAAMLLGLLASGIGQFFYLILIFPLVMGLGVGAAGAYGAKLGRFDHPLLCLFLGIFGGLLATVSMHYFDYQFTLASLQRQAPGGFLDPGFMAFTQFRAELGVTIFANPADNLRDGGGLRLTGIGAFIYWGVEMLVIVGVAAGFLFEAGKNPFCSECRSWKVPRKLGTLFLEGSATPKDLEREAMDAIAAGQLAELGPILAQGRPVTSLVLDCHMCEECGKKAPIVVTVSRPPPSPAENAKPKKLGAFVYPHEAMDHFRDLCRSTGKSSKRRLLGEDEG